MSTAASSPASTADSAALVHALAAENAQLKRQLAWFKEQLFGSKSEKRVIENPEQPLLTGLMGEPVKPLPPADKQKITYERGKAKKQRDENCVTPAAFNVLDNSIADVSFLVGMLVDKFLYHLPLYRQHQRLAQSGIDLSRGTLTNLCKRSIELLRPIAEAQLAHILQSRVLSMDETPIKADPTKNRKGKGVMKFNKKTVSLLIEAGRRWKVSPQFLSPVIDEAGSTNNVIDIQKKK